MIKRASKCLGFKESIERMLNHDNKNVKFKDPFSAHFSIYLPTQNNFDAVGLHLINVGMDWPKCRATVFVYRRDTITSPICYML